MNNDKGLSQGIWCVCSREAEWNAIAATCRHAQIQGFAYNTTTFATHPAWAVYRGECVGCEAMGNRPRERQVTPAEFIGRMYEQAEINKKSTGGVPWFDSPAMDPPNHEKRIKALEEKATTHERWIHDGCHLGIELLKKRVGKMEESVAQLMANPFHGTATKMGESAVVSAPVAEVIRKTVFDPMDMSNKATKVRYEPDAGMVEMTPNIKVTKDADWALFIDKEKSPKNISFSVALEFLKHGRIIKRVCWTKDCFVRIAPQNDALVMTDSVGYTHYAWSPAQCEMLATDWEVIPQP